MEFGSRAAPGCRCISNLPFLDMGMIYEIPLAAVPKKTLAFAGIIHDVLL